MSEITGDKPDTPSPGTLAPGEPHPAAVAARHFIDSYLRQLDDIEGPALLESMIRRGRAGGRLAQVCGETLRRLVAGEPVGERYVFGLAWLLRDLTPPPRRTEEGRPGGPDEETGH